VETWSPYILYSPLKEEEKRKMKNETKEKNYPIFPNGGQIVSSVPMRVFGRLNTWNGLWFHQQ
jgi:hypothetical protein